MGTKRFYMVVKNKAGNEVGFDTEVIRAKSASIALTCFKNTFKRFNVVRVEQV